MKREKIPPARVARAVEWVRYRLYRLNQRLVPAPVAMSELIVGGWVTQAIHAAAELGVADALANGPQPIDELARRVGANPEALERLLRALITRGVFRRRPDGRYELNALSDTLRSDAPASMAGGARFYGSPQHREHWSLLVDSIRTGKPSVPELRGMGFFDFLTTDAHLSGLFDAAMTSVSELALGPIIAGYDFAQFRTIVDVGGGRGRFLSAMLDAAPRAKGILFDQSQVLDGATELLKRYGTLDRVSVERGSFFEWVPPGGDLYTCKMVIHDWSDDDAVKIMGKVREALTTDATFVLIEQVIPDHDREFLGKWADLEMLLCLAGRERTAPQYRDLLAAAGFSMTRIVATAAPFSLIEARPV